MAHTLFSTKLRIPPVRADRVQRPHLIERLNAGLQGTVTLLSAPAGSGKTSLLVDWIAQTSLPAGWLSLEPEDNDPARFLTYLTTGIASIDEGLTTDLAAALRSPAPPPFEALMTSLIDQLDEAHDDFVMVLDDYHHIASPRIHQGLRSLIQHMPAPMHLVIATRSDPPLGIGRLRGTRQLTELRQRDLRFDVQEVAALMAMLPELSLSEAGLAALTARTEGWVTGLQMAAMAMRDHEDPERFVEVFSGTNRFVADFLFEEVFEHQDQEMQDFMVRTSILARFCPDLCDRVLERSDSHRVIARIEGENLFIDALDPSRTWYRYHALFADLLRRRLRTLPDAEIDGLHRRAAGWYRDHRRAEAAIRHGLAAGAIAFTSDIIEANIEATWGRGELGTVKAWLDRLPEAVIARRPMTAISRPLLLSVFGWRDEAKTHFPAVDRLIRSLDDGARAEPRETYEGKWLAVKAYILLFEDALDLVAAHSERALDLLPETEHTWRGMANYTLGLVLRIRRDYASAQNRLRDTEAHSLRAEHPFLCLLAMFNRGRVHLEMGRLHGAAEVFERAVGLAESHGMHTLPIAGVLLTELGGILTEWNRLDDAEAAIARGMSRTTDRASPVFASYAQLAKARLLWAQGKREAAVRLLGRSYRTVNASDVPGWVRHHVTGRLAEARVETGDSDAARQLLARAGVSAEDAPSRVYAVEHRVLARLLMDAGETAAALDLLARMLKDEVAHGAHHAAALTGAQLALGYDRAARHGPALETMRDLLARTVGAGYVRFYVDLGAPMARLLYDAAAQDIEPRYVGRVLAAFPDTGESKAPAETPALVEPLTDRELDVLVSMAQGMTNREIGRALSLSVNTIKTHASNLYGKLQVGNRTEAVTKARMLGLLPADPA
jgi:LuxR family maltose regulon positive regulatory protein